MRLSLYFHHPLLQTLTKTVRLRSLGSVELAWLAIPHVSRRLLLQERSTSRTALLGLPRSTPLHSQTDMNDFYSRPPSSRRVLCRTRGRSLGTGHVRLCATDEGKLAYVRERIGSLASCVETLSCPLQKPPADSRDLGSELLAQGKCSLEDAVIETKSIGRRLMLAIGTNGNIERISETDGTLLVRNFRLGIWLLPALLHDDRDRGVLSVSSLHGSI